jgi:hypothetical protein
MTSLPFIDEHAVDVDASPDVVWRAIGRIMGRQSQPLVRLFAGMVLGTNPRAAAGEPLALDSTVPGFRVTAAVPRERVVYSGRHRFSQYELIFELDALKDGTRLRALSYARFPGPHGRAYRALVISSGLHPKAVRHMLRSMAHAAESSTE